MRSTHIWWIRRDIRLQDNLALFEALKECDQFIPLFILDTRLMESAAPLRRSFLLNTLSDLDRQLNALGSRLVVRPGPAQLVFEQLHEELGEIKVFIHEDFSPFARQRDAEVSQLVNLQQFSGILLRHPESVLKNDGTPYTVFTPFKNKWLQASLPIPSDFLSRPTQLSPLPENILSIDLPAGTPVSGFPATAEEAQKRLKSFCESDILTYESTRDRPDLDSTSHLSPYLRFGLLSVRECFAQAHLALLKTPMTATKAEIQTWINELIWREFYTMILYHHPQVLHGPFREEYAAIPWRNAPIDLQAWQQGQTGFPIVDAFMRQMLATGWMHNRGRMIVASFLTKDLLINWQEGEAWFMKNLVDGDPAANNGGWQWSAGTGTDAAPYFRIFNPILQGKKFDPDAAFIARWVPELAQLPVKFRHEPWKLSALDADRLGFKLGQDFPERIVDRSIARDRTLNAYRFAREGTKERTS